MAEKRGQYQYNDDGSISQLVHNTNETAENSVVGVDIQARFSKTEQTHNAVLNPAASKSAWIKCDEFDYVTFNSNIAGTLKIEWSFDGTNVISDESFTTAKIGRAKIAAPWVRLDLTATGTVSTYAYLQA